MKNTIKGLAESVTVTHWAVKDDTFIGAMMATHPDSDHVFLWHWSESVTGSPFPASQVQVKQPRTLSEHPYWGTKGSGTANRYHTCETVANIHTTDLADGSITVPFSPTGLKRAVARWIRDHEAVFAIELKDYRGQWSLAEWARGLDKATERLEILRRDYGVSAYRINRQRR